MRKRIEQVPANNAPAKLLLSVEEAAEVLSLGRTLVYDLVMRRQIASIKVGRTRRVPVVALRDFIARQMGESPAQAESETAP